MAFAQGGTTGQTTTSTSSVQRRTLESSVKAVGKVTYANEQQLRFNQKGTVAKVSFKLGDHVKAGQVIAELDKSSVSADVRSAQLSVGASALQLQQLQSQKSTDLLNAQNALNDTQRQLTAAQNALAVSQEQLPTALAQAQRAVQDKQSALQQAQLDLVKAKTTEVQSLAITSQSILASSDGLLDSIYSVVTRSKESRPTQSNYELTVDHFMYNDPTMAQQVVYDYLDAVNASQKMHTQYGTSLATEQDAAKLVQALDDSQDLAQKIYKLGEDTYQMMQGAATDTSIFTSADLNSLRSTITSDRSKATDLVSQIQTAQADLTAVSSSGGIPSATLKQKQDAVTTAQNAFSQASENLQVLQTKNPADLQAQISALKKTEDDLKAKEAALAMTSSNDDVSIRLKQNDVAQKSTSLQKTAKVLADYQLTAPFDGVVTHMDYKVGDNLLDTTEDKFATLENPDFIIVTIPLDQMDVVRVQKDMPATVIFDAVPGQTFDGVIDEIDSTPMEQSGVVSYNVSVKLPTPKNLTLLSGMTATVQIQTSKKDNALVVPNLALRYQGSTATVQLANGQRVDVQTGVTDGQYTEITSGLQEGQSVVSMNLPTASAGAGNNQNAAQQLLRGAGGFGGGGGFTVGTRAGGGGGNRTP